MKKPIRVEIVRADTHGAYFAALMAPHDPLKFQRPVPVEADPPYSWMNGAAEILRLIRRMMETGKADDSMDDMIEAVAAINAGRLSVRDGGRSVSLQEVDPQ